jgi:glycosyltransferase involved in cell wall biosynthesis
MNVFLIPSWYPSPTRPISGIFVKEEAQFIAELHPEISIVVSLHGQDAFGLYLKRPLSALGVLWDFIKNGKVYKTEQLPNLWVINNPCLTWSPRILEGNMRGIIDAHKKNFRYAMSHIGKPDLIHAHVTYPAGWIAMHLSKEFGVPYLIKECMGPFPFEIPMFINNDGSLTRWIHEPLENAAQVIAMSPSLADSMAGFGFKRPLVIPYPVDDRRFTPVPYVRKQKFHFFTLCGLSPEKGIPDLLRAIPLALREVPNLCFKIGGTGNEEEYKQLSQMLGIEELVEWLGPVSREDAPRYFSECDAFIMVSHLETFGMVYAEAIASGKPVIATRCGGAEFIINNENGFLVDVGNVEKIAEAMICMYRNYDKFDNKKIRQNFLTRFSRGAIVEKLIKCYEDILGRVETKTSTL